MKKQTVLWVAAVLVLTGNGRADDVDTLLKEAKTGPVVRRVAALKELGARRDARAVNPLVDLLRHDPEWEVRLAAEEALVRLGSPSVEPLVRILREEKDCFVRRRAARALKDTEGLAGCGQEG